MFWFAAMNVESARAQVETIGLRLHVDNFFGSVDSQVEIQHEVNVMREKFFARRFLAHGLQRVYAHLEFIRRRKQGPPDRVLPNRVGDRAPLNHEIRETFARRCTGSGQSRGAGANNQEIQQLVHELKCAWDSRSPTPALKIPTSLAPPPQMIRRLAPGQLCRAPL